MPGWIVREQYRSDSIRAYNWFKATKDSSVIKRFIKKPEPVAKPNTDKLPAKKDNALPKAVAILNSANEPSKKGRPTV
jgi:penicillin-binding protein 2